MLKSGSYAVTVALLTVTLAFPAHAGAQTNGQEKHDSLWNGIGIGAAAGALVGLVVAPPVFCLRNDPECSAIVRVVIGIPAIGIGIGAGALVDGLHHQRSPSLVRSRSLKSLNVTLRF